MIKGIQSTLRQHNESKNRQSINKTKQIWFSVIIYPPNFLNLPNFYHPNVKINSTYLNLNKLISLQQTSLQQKALCISLKKINAKLRLLNEQENNNIRQTIMKRHPAKAISNLDLKLLDVKFIAIDDNQLYLTEALHSMRKAKLTELPSLLISKDKFSEGYQETFTEGNSVLSGKYMNRSTLDSINQFDQSVLSNKYRQTEFSCVDEPHLLPQQGKSFLNKKADNQTCQAQVQQIRQSIQTRNHLHNKSTNIKTKQNPSFSLQNTIAQDNQDAELQKYRKKIELIKKENMLIHKQISSLYRNKINHNKEPLKKIRKIEPFREDDLHRSFKLDKLLRNRENSADSVPLERFWQAQKVLRKTAIPKDINETPTQASKKLASCPIIREKMNFYENLTEKSPYKEQLDKIHKKIISNNLHKNFQQYLVTTSKRVPEFIKKLRN